MKLEIHGSVSLKADVRTVGDLRELVRWLDKYRVSGERELDWDTSWWLTLADTNSGDTAEMIECGDHVPPAFRYDVVINTHQHDNSVPDADEEILEDSGNLRQPPKYDWMNIDKYGTVWDGLPE